MTPDPIPAIRQRVEKATPGPWKFQVLKRGDRPHGTTMIGAVAPGHQIRANPPGGSYPSSDGEFMAHAREDIPTLLRMWDTHQTALRALVERFRQYSKTPYDMNGSQESAFADCAVELERLVAPWIGQP